MSLASTTLKGEPDLSPEEELSNVADIDGLKLVDCD